MALPVLVTLDPGDVRAGPFRAAAAPFGPRVALAFAAGNELPPALAGAEVVVTQRLTPEQGAAARRLRWLSSWAAGLDRVATPELVARGVAITSASGVHAPNIAEHVMAMMLMFTRRMPAAMRAQLAGEWRRDLDAAQAGIEELTGQTLAILGLGRIGEAIAVRARAFGMRVVAVKRDPSTRHGEAAVDRLEPMEALEPVLRGADHVCIALPLTAATRGLFDARRLSWMKPTARLYNIARGEIVDQAALVDALRARRIAGAGLDVFEHEPLEPDSPLWKLDNVILTPHVAGLTPYYFERAAAIFADNLARWLSGRPLLNRFDPVRGY